MEYHILVDGKRIASFVHEADRDICLDALKEWWGVDGNDFTIEDG